MSGPRKLTGVLLYRGTPGPANSASSKAAEVAPESLRRARVVIPDLLARARERRSRGSVCPGGQDAARSSPARPGVAQTRQHSEAVSSRGDVAGLTAPSCGKRRMKERKKERIVGRRTHTGDFRPILPAERALRPGARGQSQLVEPNSKPSTPDIHRNGSPSQGTRSLDPSRQVLVLHCSDTQQCSRYSATFCFHLHFCYPSFAILDGQKQSPGWFVTRSRDGPRDGIRRRLSKCGERRGSSACDPVNRMVRCCNAGQKARESGSRSCEGVRCP